METHLRAPKVALIAAFCAVISAGLSAVICALIYAGVWAEFYMDVACRANTATSAAAAAPATTATAPTAPTAPLSLSSVIEALSIPKSKDYTNPGWEDMEKIKNVAWQWPYYESAEHDLSMSGTAQYGEIGRNPNIGKVEVYVDGALNYVAFVDIEINQSRIDIGEFGKADVEKINTSCDANESGNVKSTYKYTRKGYKPLFISIIYRAGVNTEGTEGASIRIAYDAFDAMYALGRGCKEI